MSTDRLYDDLDQWRGQLADAELRAQGLTRARDKARAERETIAQIVRSIQSLEHRRSTHPDVEMPT